MSRILVVLLITTLVTVGPASAQTPRAEQNDNGRVGLQVTDAQIWRGVAEAMTPGSPVRIRLVRGGRISAVLLAVNDEGIVIKPKGRLPEAARTVSFSEIDLLEVDEHRGMSAGKAAAIGIGAGAAGGLAFLLVMLAAFAD